jgi:hypothetical protein
MKRNLVTKTMVILTVLRMMTSVSVHAEEPAADFSNLSLREEVPYRSPGLAVALSLGSTALLTGVGLGMMLSDEMGVPAAGGVLIGVGFVFGPSVGHVYTGNWGKGLLFSLGRIAAAGVAAAGAAVGLDWHHSSAVGGMTLMALGAASFVALTVWETVDVRNSAIAFNEEAKKTKLALSPMILPPENPGKDASPGFGLALSGRF